MKPAIYIIADDMGWGDVVAYAIAEDGHGLASHVSSGRGWSRHDMITSGWKDKRYAAHYPDGYELVDLLDTDPMTHPGFLVAHERNQALYLAKEASPS